MPRYIVRALTACAIILAAAFAYLPPASADKIPDAVDFCGESHTPDTTKITCNDKSVSDVRSLASLTNLTTLDLRATKVSAEQVKALQEKLPQCKISQ